MMTREELQRIVTSYVDSPMLVEELWHSIKSAQQQDPVAIEYWLQDTMESGRWVTTDNMAKATAEKMLSGEYGDVYPQGRIVEPSPQPSKPWVGLTDEDLRKLADEHLFYQSEGYEVSGVFTFARSIEAAHGITGEQHG